jgi:TolB-like protein/Tfp pilus assembly protein PilF
MSLITELKRRNVFRVGVAYAIVGWLLIEVASVLLPTFDAPEWVMKAFSSLVILGFPLTLVIAWAFELTPEGIKRETAVAPDESITHHTGRKLDFAIIGLLVMAVAVLVIDNYVLEAQPEPVEVIAESIPAEETTKKEQTIAVLPFANMSGDPGQEFFSDGISEELLNVLAKVKGLRVTSRTSAFAFKGKDISIPQIAEQLGVEHVLEGSVRMAGERVRITTQLIEVETDSHLWSETYDRDLADIFAVQDEIAAKVGEALKVALLGANSSPIRPSRETSIEVYSDYLLARQKLADASFKNLAESERLLNTVIERDPDYAPAYAALAEAYGAMVGTGRYSVSEGTARIIPLAEQALSLDAGLAEAWQHLANVRQLDGDFEQARAAEAKAFELDPRNAVVLRDRIYRLTWTREPERALVYADELFRVDPLSPESLRQIGFLYERLGRPDDAERMIVRMRSIDPNNNNYALLAWYHARAGGDLATALSIAPGTFDPDDPETFSWNAMHYFDLGDVAAADSWNEAALRLDSEAPHPMAIAAILHLYRNEHAEAARIARELARKGFDNRFGSRGIALRILAASDHAAGNYEGIITRNLTHYPELADGRFGSERFSVASPVWETLTATLDLASAYLHTGRAAEAEALLSLVESELPHWPINSPWDCGIADVELHVLRGEKEKALAALQKHVEMNSNDQWRWRFLYNPNLEPIRDSPEFAAVVAEIEADMADQLARVRELERNGESMSISEIPATTR